MPKKDQINKVPVAPSIKKLEVSETISFPIDRFDVVKNACDSIKKKSSFSVDFKTRMDREQCKIHVVRTK